LKRRRQEILPLLHQLVADRELALPVGAAEALLTWHWPQNVRELETLGRAYAVLRKPDQPLDLGFLEQNNTNIYKQYRQAADREPVAVTVHSTRSHVATKSPELLRLLVEHDGNVSAVAKAMGKKRNQIYRWMKTLGLTAENYRRMG
jgi:transcriptional regulator of acetoin/glycerol metabolism